MGHRPIFRNMEIRDKTRIWLRQRAEKWCPVCEDHTQTNSPCEECGNPVIHGVKPFTKEEYAKGVSQIDAGYGKRPFIVQTQLGTKIDTAVGDHIGSMRRQGEEYWDWLADNGKLDGLEPYNQWAIFTEYYWTKYYCIVPWYDKQIKAYKQVTFADKEWIDFLRLRNKVTALKTVIEEMNRHNENLVITGQPIRELLEATKKLDQRYITDGSPQPTDQEIRENVFEQHKNRMRKEEEQNV